MLYYTPMKALIPAAGHGTRFLPVTRVVPKEMLPVGSKPAIQLIVEEALAAGVTLDAAGILLDEALEALGELTGRTASALTLEQVFAHFCVGK